MSDVAEDLQALKLEQAQSTETAPTESATSQPVLLETSPPVSLVDTKSFSTSDVPLFTASGSPLMSASEADVVPNSIPTSTSAISAHELVDQRPSSVPPAVSNGPISRDYAVLSPPSTSLSSQSTSINTNVHPVASPTSAPLQASQQPSNHPLAHRQASAPPTNGLRSMPSASSANQMPRGLTGLRGRGGGLNARNAPIPPSLQAKVAAVSV